jgi:hypothetical protein
MHKIGGVRGIGRPVGISHQFAIAMICRDQAFSIER